MSDGQHTDSPELVAAMQTASRHGIGVRAPIPDSRGRPHTVHQVVEVRFDHVARTLDDLDAVGRVIEQALKNADCSNVEVRHRNWNIAE